MCDDRDEEAERYTSMAKGDFHTVTLNVTVRITVDVPGSSHHSDDLEDMVTDDAMCEGDIQSVEEV